jgi:LmbE family N-acetylglucosaminyl deacetylase
LRHLWLTDGVPTPPTVLCLGAHSDDIEIGAGGLVGQLARLGATFHWAVFCAPAGPRRDEAERSAAALLRGARESTVVLESFRESYLPWTGDEVKDRFEKLKLEVRPDLVLTHHRQDRHQDHQLIAELTHNTFRDHLVLEYEIPKYEGDLTPANVFVPLTTAEAAAKVGHLLSSFRSQESRSWFDAETFRGLLRLRGLECNAPDGYAEAFHGPKVVLGLPGADPGALADG